MNTRIKGTGSSLPQKVLTNDDLAKLVDTNDEWISSRTGIKRRRISNGETSSQLGAQAALKALENAGVESDQVDLIIVATSSPDYAFPSTAACVQSIIGASNAACFDMSVACTGFVFALSTADAFIRAGVYKTVLVIGAEVMSSEIDWSDRSVCVLFGDGAGAAVLQAEDVSQMVSDIHSDGSRGLCLTSNAIQINKDESAVKNIVMNGREVFKFAVKQVPESINEVLKKANADKSDIKYYVLHQANERIIESVAKRLGESIEKFPMNIENYGNTSAASVPILLDELNRSGMLKTGDKIILSGFGGGLSWGSIYLEW